jgi:biopolymer transport protein ExbD
MSSRIALVRPHRLPPRLELTPLIDCVFLLLVFFLLTASFSHQGAIDLELPAVSGEAADAAEPGILQVTINRDGSVLISDQTMTRDALKSFFVSMTAGDRVLPGVRIYADRQAPAGVVIETLDAARSAGLQRVEIAGEIKAQE